MVRTVMGSAALAGAGFVVGMVGTSLHRYHPYVGLVAVLVLVLAAGIFARAWLSWAGLVAFAAGWTATVLVLALTFGPGGSKLILDDALGRFWIYGGSVCVVLAALAPGFFFRDSVDESA